MRQQHGCIGFINGIQTDEINMHNYYKSNICHEGRAEVSHRVIDECFYSVIWTLLLPKTKHTVN